MEQEDKCPSFYSHLPDGTCPALLYGSGWLVWPGEPSPSVEAWACGCPVTVAGKLRLGGGGHGSDAWAPAGLRRVMLRAHRQAWCWQDEWTELSMADIRALEEETARMLAQRMAKCNTGSEGPEAQAPGKPSVEARAVASHAGTPDGPEASSGPDASPDASFGKQWSSSSRSSYSSQHGGEAGAQGQEGAPSGWMPGLRGMWPCRGRVSAELV